MTSPARLLLLLLTLTPACFFATPDPADALPSSDDQTFHFSVKVQMVVLQAAVFNRKGSFVNGLRQRNFQVFEDNQKQSLGLFRHADSPVAVGLIVDNSGSMRRKHSAIVAAAKAFARNSNPRDELFVINFNDQVSLGLPRAQLFSGNSRQLERALPATAAGGKTALYDALEEGIAHVHQLHQDKKALILISDGGDNASTHTIEQVMADATNSDVVIYTIGLFGKYDDETNPDFLKKLAQVTGGEAFLPARPGQAAANCKKIARTIRNVYTLGYSPTNVEQNGKFRAIQVNVSAPRHGTKLLARTRIGYTPGTTVAAATAPSR